LRDGALAEGTADVSLAADEILIGAGLDAGDGSSDQRGETAEWEAISLEDETAPAPDPQPTRILEPVPAEDEIRVTAWTDIEVTAGEEEEPGEDLTDEKSEVEEVEEGNEMTERDWLSEVSRDATLEWPAAEGERRPHLRERIDTPRVRHLFPVPDDADWSVRELEYRRRAQVG
jgi:hypothetical protein